MEFELEKLNKNDYFFYHISPFTIANYLISNVV